VIQTIHPTAIIHERAVIGNNVHIGPYCVVGEHVRINDDVTLVSHISIGGHTTIGERTVIYPFASLGHPPQDLKFKGEASRLEIGTDNVIREHVTMNPGTQGGGLLTKVGDNGLFMVASHIAHDCVVGDYVIMANNATLAGHVHVGDHAVIGGLAAIHQFVRIGKHAMVGGMSGVEHDVIPYGSVMGERASLAGLNLVGLKRRGFDRDTIHAMRNLYKDLFDGDHTSIQQRAETLKSSVDNKDIAEMFDFILSESKRSLCVPKH
jgi:UDP-N-acetylglucosamine acyltransferase